VFAISFATFWLIKKAIGLRVSPEHEERGLDITEHGMWGYPEQFMPVPGAGYMHPSEVEAASAVAMERTRLEPSPGTVG
jgi:Amt family ammonium transporter